MACSKQIAGQDALVFYMSARAKDPDRQTHAVIISFTMLFWKVPSSDDQNEILVVLWVLSAFVQAPTMVFILCTSSIARHRKRHHYPSSLKNINFFVTWRGVLFSNESDLRLIPGYFFWCYLYE